MRNIIDIIGGVAYIIFVVALTLVALVCSLFGELTDMVARIKETK